MNLAGQRVLVVGLGKSGSAAANFLRVRGAQVSITDKRPRGQLKPFLKQLPSKIQVEAGSHHLLKKPFDLIVTSPGVHYDLPELIKNRRKGIPVWPELELAWRFVRPFKTVAVTGTNGKTTTTALLGHIFRKAGKPTVVGGNIGVPLSSLVKKITSKTILVLEVSSYQLEAQGSFHPDVGIVLNVTPDHLARHRTMSNYARMKGRLFKNCTAKDFAVLNRQDLWCRKIGRATKARKIWFPNPKILKLAQDISLPGEHNLQNAMAAASAARVLKIRESVIRKALRTFPGVPHRLQFVRELRGVRYINDSKGTNVDSTLVALKAAARPTILILGGEHKGSPYTPLLPIIKRKVKEVITIGEAAPIVARDLKGAVPITPCGNMEKAVRRACQIAQRGDDVLLSPACASFDQFKNFEERGHHFEKLVGGLK